MKIKLDNIFKAIPALKDFSPGSESGKDYAIPKFNNQVLVLISICDQSDQIYVCKGKGENVQKAIESALAEYILHFGNPDANPKAVRLDLVKRLQAGQKEKKVLDLSCDDIIYIKGLEGIALGNDLEIIFLPEEVCMHKIIENKRLNFTSLDTALEHNPRLPLVNEFLQNLSGASRVPVYKVRFDSYYFDDQNSLTLYEGRRSIFNIDKDLILEAIRLTRDNYFKNITTKKGKFIYSYLPWLDQKEKRYNLLRHAGTTYAILETHELIPDQNIFEIAELTIGFLLSKVAYFELGGRSVAALVDKDSIKLGGNALAIIALAKYSEITGNHGYIPAMQKMAAWMLETQAIDGSFSIHVQYHSTGKVKDFESHYYPGEAILALVRLYRLDGDTTWLDAAEGCAQYLINIRDSGSDIDSISHDHWLLYALNELYRERRKHLYMDHALLIAEAIMKSQIKGQDKKPYANGAYCLPHPRLESTPTAIRAEGLGAAYHLAFDFGLHNKARKIKKAMRESIRFQLQTQLRPETVFFYKNKKRCLGAFQKGINQYDLRIDYTQHNISSLIAYYRIITNCS